MSNLLKWDGGVSTYKFDDILLTGDEGGVGESKLMIEVSVMRCEKCLVRISEINEFSDIRFSTLSIMLTVYTYYK